MKLKTLTKFLILILSFSSCNIGQNKDNDSSKVYNFNIQDFESLLKANDSEFENFVMQKGYSPDTESEMDGYRKYMCDYFNSDHRKTFIVRSKNLSDSQYIISYATTDKNYYINFKKSLGDNGYTFIKSRDTKQTPPLTQYFYTNKVYTSVLFSQSDDNGLIWYETAINTGNLESLLKGKN